MGATFDARARGGRRIANAGLNGIGLAPAGA
jgi:hypothetical protein